MPTLSVPQVLSVFSLSRKWQTAPVCHLRRPFCVLWVLVFNNFFDVLLGQRSKPGSYVFASSLTTSTKRELRNHAPWSYMTYMTWLLYNLQLRFRPIRKEIVSWMYNNDSNLVQFRVIIIRNYLNWSGIIRLLARCFGNKSRFVWLHHW